MKKRLLTVRMDEDKYLEFQAASEVRGIGMSALVTQFAFQIIRETKRDMAAEFEEMLAKLIAEKADDAETGPDEFTATPYEDDNPIPLKRKGVK